MLTSVCVRSLPFCALFFFFNDTATTEIYTLSLHDALPICEVVLSGDLPKLPGATPGWMASKDRKSTRLNSSHVEISYAVFCLKKKNTAAGRRRPRRGAPGPPSGDLPGRAARGLRCRGVAAHGRRRLAGERGRANGVGRRGRQGQRVGGGRARRRC